MIIIRADLIFEAVRSLLTIAFCIPISWRLISWGIRAIEESVKNQLNVGINDRIRTRTTGAFGTFRWHG